MTRLTQWVPRWLKHWRRPNAPTVRYQSVNRNIYHCTIQKSASQWMRVILADPRTFSCCGLSAILPQRQGEHDPRKLTERSYLDGFPDLSIITPIYIHYEGFAAIPKRTPYKAIFVMRDPRDVVVSWYFSVKHSHRAMGEIERIRRDLDRLPESDGLLYSIDYLNDFGLFQAQRSWAQVDASDPNVLLMRFEDLIGPDQLTQMERLMKHCDIRMPANELVALMEAHRFEKLSGRARGEEDVQAHYRKGIAGDWRNHFDDVVQSRIRIVAGDILDRWNY